MYMWQKLNLLDPVSPMMIYLNYFHEYSMMFIIIILSLTFYMIIILILNKFNTIMIKDHQLLELLWTIAPSLILMFLAFPSLKILYLTDEMINPNLTIKVLGNQWYWSYQYGDWESFINFDSYMKKDLYLNSFRLLDVDNNTPIPVLTNVRFIVSSNDVIHSFTIPSLGMKIDAIPGRLNQWTTWSSYPGMFYGQCSEICGVNHSFMPIVIESIQLDQYLTWVINMMIM